MPIVSYFSCWLADFVLKRRKMKKNHKKVAKMFGGFRKVYYLCSVLVK